MKLRDIIPTYANVTWMETSLKAHCSRLRRLIGEAQAVPLQVRQKSGIDIVEYLRFAHLALPGGNERLAEVLALSGKGLVDAQVARKLIGHVDDMIDRLATMAMDLDAMLTKYNNRPSTPMKPG